MITRVSFDSENNPCCRNGDILIIVQFESAEIVKFISPKPFSAPDDGNDFIFQVCDNDDDGLEEEALQAVMKFFPEAKQSTEVLLFTCPEVFAKKAVFSDDMF